jgi:hypothetical protein
MEFHQARAGPLESLVPAYALTAGNLGPPCLDTHGPPGPMRDLGDLPAESAAQSSDQAPFDQGISRIGVLQQPLASFAAINRHPAPTKNRI